MANIVGIDLGTTNSLCAVFLAEQPRLIPECAGAELLTPSVVGVLEDGQILVGVGRQGASSHATGERCASCFKRLMGSSETVELGDRKVHRARAVEHGPTAR